MEAKIPKPSWAPLRILMLHNRYDVRGGEDESTDCEVRLLQSHGHHVQLLTADNSLIGNGISRSRAAASAIWNQDWYDRVLNELVSGDYDLLHAQNLFPLISPSVYYAAARAEVPVVQAVRNYRLMCPSANFFRDGTVCHACHGHLIKWPGIRKHCYRDSASGSAVVAAMTAVHSVMRTWSTKVSRYIAISDFVKTQLVAEGFASDLIAVKPNFAELRPSGPPVPAAGRNHFLYVGRISAEKGVDVLLAAASARNAGHPILLVGEGAVEDRSRSVQVLGRRSLEEVYALMRTAIAVVMPGRWEEPFGRVAVEAFAAGTPVIASGGGGLAELVVDGVNGFTVPAGDPAQLADRMDRIVFDQERLDRMCAAARATFSANYTPDANYEALMSIYAGLLGLPATSP